MSFEAGGENQDNVALVPWDPNKYVRGVDPFEASLSRGFLRCRPEKWFPGFATHWLPLTHSLGVEIKILEVKPVLSIPQGIDQSFVATIDEEPISFHIDEQAFQVLLEVVCPGAIDNAKSVVVEYLARRLLTSMHNSWSGPESSIVRFDAEMSADNIRPAGGVKLSLSVNGENCVIWIGLGKAMVENLDGLWRRQIQSSGRVLDDTNLHLVVAQIAVPPSMLSEYMKAGALVDLETPISDQLLLYSDAKPWLPARICRLGSKLGFETISAPVNSPMLPEGTTRVAIEFGIIALDAASVSEMSQVGAICETGLELNNRVSIVINNEVVGSGVLCTYEGRFAISVE